MPRPSPGRGHGVVVGSGFPDPRGFFLSSPSFSSLSVVCAGVPTLPVLVRPSLPLKASVTVFGEVGEDELVLCRQERK